MKTANYAILLLLLARFVMTGWVQVGENWNSDTLDQGPYLQLGLDIRECKALSDGNRHPLYPALMALFAERDWAYFTRVKILTLALGTMCLMVVYGLSCRLVNEEVALLTVFLLSVNRVFSALSCTIMCESLLVILFFMAWYFTIQGFVNRRCWVLAGVCAGLAYLTKSSGQALLVCFILTSVIVYRTKVWTKSGLLIFPLFYLLVASPLLVYNYQAYHNPLYNINTNHVLWFDTWEEYFIAPGQSYPTMLTYLQTHSIRDVAARLWKGIRMASQTVAQTLMPGGVEIGGLWQSPITWAVVALLTVAGLWYFRDKAIAYFRAHRERVIVTVTLIGILGLPLIWYAPVISRSRFWAPLLPIVYLFVSEILHGVARFVAAPLLARFKLEGRTSIWVGYLAFYACLAALVLPGAVEAAGRMEVNPFRTDREQNVDRDRVLTWLAEQVNGHETVIWGPSHALPRWKFSDKIAFEPIPYGVIDWREFDDFLVETGARYVVLDRETFNRRSGLLAQYFDIKGMKIVAQTLPPGWELVLAYPGHPCDFCVFQRTHPLRIEPSHPVQALLGDQARLIGYDLSHQTVQPGDTLHLTLYWEAVAEMDKDYTVFTHLLSPDGTVAAAKDNPPIRALLPTSLWPVGVLLVDHYDIDLPPDAGSGDYELEVGMYLFETLERLPVTDEHGRRLPEDRVLLGTVRVTDD